MLYCWLVCNATVPLFFHTTSVRISEVKKEAIEVMTIVSKNYLHTSHFQRVGAVTKRTNRIHQFVFVLNPATEAAR